MPAQLILIYYSISKQKLELQTTKMKTTMEDTSQDEKVIKEQERKLLEIQKLQLTKKVEQFKLSWKGFLITWLIGSAFYGFLFISDSHWRDDWETGTSILLTVFAGLLLEFYYFIIWGIIRMVYINRLSSILIKLSNFESKQIQESIETNFFTKLVQLNFKYLDKYYLQTQIQADKSFGLCLFAALFALVIIAVGIVLMFLSAYDKNILAGDSVKLSSYVVTASGVLSEFIAAVFFYLYNQTILKMSEYHQKLVLTQNISLALKISEGLPEKEKQSESQQFLIRELTKDVNFHLMNNGGLNKTVSKVEN